MKAFVTALVTVLAILGGIATIIATGFTILTYTNPSTADNIARAFVPVTTPHVVEKLVTVEVTQRETVEVEKPVTVVVEQTVPVEKIVKQTVVVPVVQTVIVEKSITSSETRVAASPASTLLFEDDFDGGLKADWRMSDGVWRVANETLQADPERIGRIEIGDASWVDYVVELDFGACSRCELSVRNQDNENRMMFTFRNFTNAD